MIQAPAHANHENRTREVQRPVVSTPVRLIIALLVFVLIVSIFKAAFNNVIPSVTKQRLSKIGWVQALSLLFISAMIFRDDC